MSETQTIEEDKDIGQPESPGLVAELGSLAPATLLDEKALAQMLRLHPASIRRLVRRGQLPPGVRLGARRVWLVSRLFAHFDALAERAAREAERERHRISQLSP